MTRRWLIDNQGLFFMAPAMVLFVVFVLYPIFYIFNASLYDWDGINEAIYVGVQNYIEMFTNDRAFAVSIRNSVYWTFLTIFPQMILGFILAYILTSVCRCKMSFASSSLCPPSFRRLCSASSGSGFMRPLAACWRISDLRLGRCF